MLNGKEDTAGAFVPVWMMVLCSVVMGFGTSVGGKKIIKSVGMDMVKLEKIPGLFRRYGSGGMYLIFYDIRDPGQYDAYEDNGDHGCRRGETAVRDQL